MQHSDLLFLWALSISWSAVFLIAVSIYLYARRKHRAPDKVSTHVRLNDFVFVIVLAALLGLYIVSIDRTSSLIFAAGNIIVEVILVAYTVKNKTGTT
jgi:heme/copper-type cytochrome/quinol oxidase subunit 2